MAPPTPVTEPGVQCNATRGATRRHVAEHQVGCAALHRGVVGERRHGQVLGHAHQGHVGVGVRPHDGGGFELARRADDADVGGAAQQIGRRGDHAALGHGDADERHRAVGGGGPQLHHGVSGRLGGGRHRVLRSGQGGDGAGGDRVAGRTGALERVLGGGGEQDDEEGHHGGHRPRADQGHERGARAVARGRVDEHRAVPAGGHLARMAPQTVVGVDPPALRGFGPLGACPPRSSGPGSPSWGSSGVSLTMGTIPRTALEVPSRDGPVVP